MRVSPHSTCQHCLSLGENSLHFWTARRKLNVLTRRDRHRSRKTTITSFQTAWDVRNFSEMWGLSYRLSGRPVGPRLRPIWVFRNGLSFSPLLGTKEVVVLKLRTEILLLFLNASRGRRLGFSCQDYVENVTTSEIFSCQKKAVPSWEGSSSGGHCSGLLEVLIQRGSGVGHTELKHSGFGPPFARCLPWFVALIPWLLIGCLHKLVPWTRRIVWRVARQSGWSTL